ncbi:MAG: HEPN domain-containing protein [Candidatus Sigynarchaeota archaeon]
MKSITNLNTRYSRKNLETNTWRQNSGAMFHFIQAAEKAVKGLLYLLNLHPWGHSLSSLLMECEKQGVTVKPEFKASAKAFEVHYTGSRYPDASPTPPRKA